MTRQATRNGSMAHSPPFIFCFKTVYSDKLWCTLYTAHLMNLFSTWCQISTRVTYQCAAVPDNSGASYMLTDWGTVYNLFLYSSPILDCTRSFWE